MKSLLSAVHILSNLYPDANFNKLSTCATAVNMSPPISMKKMIEEIEKLPTLTKIDVCITKTQHGPSISSVKAGEQFGIEVTALWDQYGNKMKGLKISFAVSDPEVGVIIGLTECKTDSNGFTRTIVETKKTGTLTVYATNGNITGSTSIVVTPPPVLTKIGFYLPSIDETGRDQPYLEENFAREAFAIDQYGDDFEVVGLKTFFTIDNPEIVNITTSDVKTNSSGRASCNCVAINIGATTLHASFENVTGSNLITVSARPKLSRIDVRCSTSSVEQGNSFTVDATAWDQYDNKMEGVKISFKVSDSAVGVIEGATENTTNQNGEASATVETKGAGTLTIYATNGGITGSTNVTVNPKTGILLVTLTSTSGNWGVYNCDTPDPLFFSQIKNAIITNVKISTSFRAKLTHKDVNVTKSVDILTPVYEESISTFNGMKVEGQWHAELNVTEAEAPNSVGITIYWRAP